MQRLYVHVILYTKNPTYVRKQLIDVRKQLIVSTTYVQYIYTYLVYKYVHFNTAEIYVVKAIFVEFDYVLPNAELGLCSIAKHV